MDGALQRSVTSEPSCSTRRGQISEIVSDSRKICVKYMYIIYIYSILHTYIHIYSIYVHIYIYIYIVYMYTYIHISIYIHTCIHIYIYTLNFTKLSWKFIKWSNSNYLNPRTENLWRSRWPKRWPVTAGRVSARDQIPVGWFTYKKPITHGWFSRIYMVIFQVSSEFSKN